MMGKDNESGKLLAVVVWYDGPNPQRSSERQVRGPLTQKLATEIAKCHELRGMNSHVVMSDTEAEAIDTRNDLIQVNFRWSNDPRLVKA